MELIMDRFGRVVLPKALRRDFCLHPGSRLLVKERGKEIVLRPEEAQAPCAVKNGVLVYTGKAAGDIAGHLHRMREERDAACGGL